MAEIIYIYIYKKAETIKKQSGAGRGEGPTTTSHAFVKVFSMHLCMFKFDYFSKSFSVHVILNQFLEQSSAQ